VNNCQWSDSKFAMADISQNNTIAIQAKNDVIVHLSAVVNLNQRWSTRSFPNTVEEPKAKAAKIA